MKQERSAAAIICLMITCVLCLSLLLCYYYYYYPTTDEVSFTDDRRMERLMLLGNSSATHAKPSSMMTTQITMCTMLKNEAKYVREWVEFHSLLGVNRFIIFDNDSSDSLRAALNGTIAEAIIIPWPPKHWLPGNPHEERCQGYKDGKYRDDWAYSYCQTAAFHECLRWERGRSRWVAGVDVDEFFMPRYSANGLRTLQEALKPYEHMHGISLGSFTYGTSHRTVPIAAGDLMIETHLLRGNDPGVVKEFVDPQKADTYHCVHWAHYTDPLWNTLIMRTVPRWRSAVRFNHFPFRSIIESRHKVFKNMNPGIYQEIDKWDKVDIEDLFLVPMVPLIRRRLTGERIWIRHDTSMTQLGNKG